MKPFALILIVTMFLTACAHPGRTRTIDTGEIVVDRNQAEKGQSYSYMVERRPEGDDIVIQCFDKIEIIEQKNKVVDTEQTYYKYSLLNEVVELCAWVVVIPGVLTFFYPMISGKSLEGEDDRFHATFYDSFSMLNPFMNAYSGAVSSPYIASIQVVDSKSQSVPVGTPISYEKRIPKDGAKITAVYSGKHYAGKTDLVGEYRIRTEAQVKKGEILTINGEQFLIP
jgi:hypothetical protein